MGAPRARSRLLVVVIVSAVACTDTDRDDVTEIRSAVLAPNTNGAQIQSFVLDATETTLPNLLEKARRLVALDIDPLPPVYTIDEALDGTTIVWGTDNIFKSFLVQRGA